MAAKNPLGPIGVNVQHNVKRLREDQNLTLAELARRLEAFGRKIPPLGLSRIEAGERRVDADDLVALAAALLVSPATLLLPPEDPGEPIKLTEGEKRSYSVPWSNAWRWATGAAPLGLASDPDERSYQVSEWVFRNQPHRREAIKVTITQDEFFGGNYEGPEDEEGNEDDPGR